MTETSLRRLEQRPTGWQRSSASIGLQDRFGMGRLGLGPAVRYERSRPGEPVDVDVKPLGRIEGTVKRVFGSWLDRRVPGASWWPLATITRCSRDSASDLLRGRVHSGGGPFEPVQRLYLEPVETAP